MKIPDKIAHEHEIPAEAKQGRAISRALLAYSGPEKTRFLNVTIAMIMAGALPEHGQKRNWRPPIDQQDRQSDLAGRLSIRRETLTRWLSKFATVDETWAEEKRRLKHREYARDSHAKRGHNLREQPRPKRPRHGTLIHRRRRFMQPNHYEPGFGHLYKARPNDWFPPRPEDLAARPELGKFFRAVAGQGDWWEGLKPAKEPGFKHIPLWLWDPALPLSWKARLVMTFYFLCGLGSKHKKTGKIIGTVKPSQLHVARALGFGRQKPCTRTVYKANKELAALGLIRVAYEKRKDAQGNVIKTKDGRVMTANQIIVYLPIRYLSEEEAAEERERLKLMDKIRQFTLQEDRNAWMASRVKELHEKHLRAYMGREHQHPTDLATFWKAVTYAAIAEGIQLRVVRSLIPAPPN